MAKFDAKRINSQYNIKISLIRQKKKKTKKKTTKINDKYPLK